MRFFISTFLLTFGAGMVALAPIHAQQRAIGAGALVLDDGSGHTVTIYAPSLTGSYPLKLPSSNVPGALVNDGSGNLTWSSASSVSSFSAGTTGLTPNAPTGGAVVLGGTLNAASGGTGQNTYATGDMLYASNSSTISKLHLGTMNQVLSISGGIPAWTNNGATITNNTSSASIATSQNDFTITPTAALLRISNTSAGTLNITGINHTGMGDGRMVTLVNVSAEPIQIVDENVSSLAGDQFLLPGAAPILLAQWGTATFVYDATTAPGFWELVSTN